MIGRLSQICSFHFFQFTLVAASRVEEDQEGGDRFLKLSFQFWQHLPQYDKVIITFGNTHLFYQQIPLLLHSTWHRVSILASHQAGAAWFNYQCSKYLFMLLRFTN